MTASINTIAFASIVMTAGTQFRDSMIEDNVIDMMDLIERGVPFKTPIRLAKFNDTLYLTDGFHRMEAYNRLKITHVPADQCAITEVGSIEEVRVLAAGANVQHGKGNSNADYHNIIKKLMEFGDAYMKNAFEPDISKIATAIGAAQPAVGRGYNNYPKDDYEARLSTICKAKRDAAITEKHKEGAKVSEIQQLFGLKKDVVYKVVNELSGNPESGNPENTPESSTILPLASTLDRPETREDAAAYFDAELQSLVSPDFMQDFDDDAMSLTMDEADIPPFDVLAATGYTAEQTTHTKPQAPATTDEVTAEMLEKELDDALAELSKAQAKVARIRQEAAINGITLSK